MALAKKRSNNTRTIVIVAVVIAAAGIGYVLFNQFFLKNRTNTNATNSASRSSSVISNFNEVILNDSRFTNLKSYDTTINADANRDGGQSNPFR